jgi:glycosyltransferase involved in cell wall biosynthesis
VVFTGYVPPGDLPALYAGAACFVFPSVYEGFGLPVLEAMAAGAPVVASRVGAIPEVAGDAALLVDAAQPAALAEAIEAVLADRGLRAQLVERGRARARAFSWEATARRTLAVYEAVHGRGRVEPLGARGPETA